MGLGASPAHAKEYVFEAPQPAACAPASRMGNLTCTRVPHGASYQPAANSDSSTEQSPMLNFSEADSEAAIAMFGCDCIVCINALRQVRGLPPV